MKNLSLLLISFFNVTCNLYAQNPFSSLGIKDEEVPILSISKGKYQEIITNDTLVKVGNVVVNTVTGRVEYFIRIDTVRSEASMEPQIVSRWLSPDPIFKAYESPYAAMSNNPILFTDPDGRDPIDPRTGKPSRISLVNSVVVANTYDPKIHLTTKQDVELLAWTQGELVRFSVGKDFQAPIGFFDDFPNPDRSANLISDAAAAVINPRYGNKLRSFTTPKSIGGLYNPPSIDAFEQGAKTGYYSYIDEGFAEKGLFYRDIKSFNLIDVEANTISRVTNFARNSSGEFDINSVSTFSTQKGDIQTGTRDGQQYKYRNVTTTETIEHYQDNKAVGKSTQTHSYQEEVK